MQATERARLQVEAKAVEPRLWKKTKAAERIKREYRTADEVLAEATEKVAAAPILDMRGPQARLITDMEDLNAAKEEAEADATPMPELQHNLRVMVDLAASEIQRLDGKLRHSKVWLPSNASSSWIQSRGSNPIRPLEGIQTILLLNEILHS